MSMYDYSFQNKKRDLADILLVCIKDEPRFISNFKTILPVTQEKFVWLDEVAEARER